MRSRPSSALERRLRHAASRFQEQNSGTEFRSVPKPDQYHDWMTECVRSQKSFAACDSFWNTSRAVQSEDSSVSLGGNSSSTMAVVLLSDNSSAPAGKVLATDDSDDEADIRQLYQIVLPVLLTACVLSLLFNIVIVFSVRWVRKTLSPTLYLSLSLAVADAYASLVLGLGFVVNSLLPIVYGVNLGPFNACFVLVLEAFRLGGVVVAVLHLLALAINHYLGILRPLHYAATVTKGTVLWVIAAMWLLPVLFFLAYFSLVPEDGFQSPYCSSYEFLLRIPFRATVSVLFFVPLVLMSVMYMHMFVVVKRHQRGLLQLPSSRQLHKSVKAIITTLLILGTYLLGWMPAVLYFILTCLDCPVPFTQIHLWVRIPVGIFINSMIVVKSFVDPIVYVVRMPEIQCAMRDLFRTRCGCVAAADEQLMDHSVQSKSEMNRLTVMSSRRRKKEDVSHDDRGSPNGCVGGDM